MGAWDGLHVRTKSFRSGACRWRSEVSGCWCVWGREAREKTHELDAEGVLVRRWQFANSSFSASVRLGFARKREGVSRVGSAR